LRILQRYFWREMAQNFAGVTIALGAILIIYQLGAVLARAAELQYPQGLVLELFALGAAENFAILLPLGLLLGVVLAVGRLYHENEMVAAQACGFGRGRELQVHPGTQRRHRQGQRLNGVPGEQKFRRLQFQSLRIPLAAPELAVHRARLDERPTAQLLHSTDRPARAELQWRLGLPLMVLVGAACALPLGRLRPRQGRYARVWQAVVLFAVYGNLTTAARTWYERGATPAALGLWWVHALFIAFAVWLSFGGLSLFRGRRR